MEQRFTITNMTIEAGGKAGLMVPDATTLGYVRARAKREWQVYEPDPDAQYVEEHDYEVSDLEPMVALPFSPDNVVPLSKAPRAEIDQVFIGSCTNGRLSDLRLAAQIMEGRQVHPRVRCMVIPASNDVYLAALKEGLLTIFAEAGCAVSTSTCGPCLGGYMGVLAEGERCVSTSNRNFPGRMGHPKAEVYLVEPGGGRRQRHRRPPGGPGGGGAMTLRGRVHKFGANIDTDVIIPAHYLNMYTPEELAPHCLEGVDPEFAGRVRAGRHHRGRDQLRLRLLARARAAGHPRRRRGLRGGQELRPHLLPQRHQPGPAHPGVPGGGGRQRPRR